MNDNNGKINWKVKLTSRKFWTAVVGFMTPLLVAFGCTDSTVTQATGIIMGAATLIAYIIGEGLVDSSRAAATTSSSSVSSIVHTNIREDANNPSDSENGNG